jgi:hypothetical protein
MSEEKKDVKNESGATEKEEVKAPVSSICDDAQKNAAAQVDESSEIKPVQGFFLTSQRWH